MSTKALYQEMLKASAANDHDRVLALGARCVGEIDADLSLMALRADAHAVFGHALNEHERLPEAIGHLEHALYGPLSHHLRVYQRSALTMLLANSYWKVGRYDDVQAAVAPVLQGEGTPAQAATALRILSSVTWRRTGNLAEATSLLEQSAIAGGHTGGLWWRDAVYRGQYLMELGRLEEAEQVLRHGVEREREEMVRLGQTDRATVANLAIFLGALARVEVRLGHVELATSLHEEAARLLPPSRKFGAFTWNLCAAEIALAGRDFDRATQHADACIDLTTMMAARPSMAVSWKLRGRVDRDRDRDRDAIEWFQRACDAYRHLGHLRDTHEMENQLRALGA